MRTHHALVLCVAVSGFFVQPGSKLLAAVLGGTIDSVSPADKRLVVKTGKDEKRHPLRVDAAVKITIDGKAASFADLKPGQQASVFTTDDLATRITVRSEAAAPVRKDPPPRKELPAKPERTASTPSATAAQPWPQFRGPNRDNISHEKGLLKSWPNDGPRLLWTAKGLGNGYSSVSVAGGLVLTMGNQGNQEAILAVDLKTGQPAWMTPNGQAYRESRGDGPRCVPTVDGSLAYALGGNGDLSCVEVATGKSRWKGNILQEFGSRNLTWGICESPLIDGDQLICTPGGHGAVMVALNKQTGKLLWSTTSPDNEKAGYASAIVATVGGVRQYIQLTSEGTIGVRATDGAFMWKDTSAANSTANCSAPIFANDCVFSASGYGTGGALVRLASSRGMTASSLAYRTKEMKNHHGGMVLLDGYLYGFDEGTLVCLEFMTGKVMWQSRSVGKGSLTYADGHLYLRGENGRVALAEASPQEYREKSRFEQSDRSDYPAWPYPVVADGKLFLRDMDVLLCYDVKGSGG